MKNKVFIVIAIIIVLMVAQFGVLIDSVKAETITGSDGDVSWSFDSETKTLIFSGNGVIRKEWGDNIKKSGIVSIVINDGITSIGKNAFHYCDNLTSVIVDSENKNYCSEDGILFNRGKTEIIKYPAAKEGGSYTIPSSVTSIGDYAFCDCKNLTSVIVDSENKNYCSEDGILFNRGKTEIIKYPAAKEGGSYTIPSSVTRIGNFAFDHCQNLTIYCKSDSDAPIYAKESRVTYQIDDNAPRITSLVQEGEYIKIEATDDGVGLDNEAYSINGKDWQESNTFIVTESGKYKIHVRDALDNIAEKEIEVASFKENDGDTNKDDSKDNTEDKTDENKNNKQENKTPSKDDTQAPSKIPQTGTISIFSIFIILGIISVISYKKFKKNNY